VVINKKQDMKNIFFTVLAMAVMFAAFAETPVPDFKNQPMLLVSGKLVKLEKQSAEIKNRVHGMGYGGTTSNLHLDGGASNVRSTTKPEFLIKVDTDVDPETLFYLSLCHHSKKGREVELSKQSAFAGYGAGGKSVKRFHVKLNYEKISDGIYKITVDEPLEATEEYAFVSVSQGSTNGSNSTAFLFGVK
jgi:hypothetical protein